MFDFRKLKSPFSDVVVDTGPNWRVRACFCLLLGVELVAFFAVYVSRPETRYLAEFDGISWILYPMAPNSVAFPVAQQTTDFSRTLRLNEKPKLSILKLRAFRDAEVRINGSRLTESATSPKSWKSAAEYDVTSLLAKGDNSIEVTVNNSNGPPALWVQLDVDGRQIRSDSEWNCSLLGATETSAITAGTRLSLRPGHSMAHPEHMSISLINLAPLLIALAVFWLVFFIVFFIAKRRNSSFLSFVRRYDVVVCIIPIMGWLAIGVLNLSSLNFPMGHDVDDHFEYIRYVQKEWRAPLALTALTIFVLLVSDELRRSESKKEHISKTSFLTQSPLSRWIEGRLRMRDGSSDKVNALMKWLSGSTILTRSRLRWWWPRDGSSDTLSIV